MRKLILGICVFAFVCGLYVKANVADITFELSSAYKDVKEVVDKLVIKDTDKPFNDDLANDVSEGILFIIEKIKSLYNNKHIDEQIRDEYVNKFTDLCNKIDSWQKG